MEVFLLQYKKKRKITRELIENLCQEMNQNFFIKVMSSNNTNFIFQNFVGEIKKDFENKKKKSYMEIIKYLIQSAIRINEVLKSSNLNNYDYIEDDKEREEVLNVQNNRLILAQFFSNTILNIILSDLQYVLISYIKEQNQT